MSSQTEVLEAADAEARLRAVRLAIAVVDDDEQSWREASSDLDLNGVLRVTASLAALVVAIGKDVHGSADALRWRLLQLAGDLETTAEFGMVRRLELGE